MLLKKMMIVFLCISVQGHYLRKVLEEDGVDSLEKTDNVKIWWIDGEENDSHQTLCDDCQAHQTLCDDCQAP